MFGLMRAKKCGMSDEEKQFRRLNYCGTCKTIGSQYSPKARLLLNHDAVFLAEFLTAVQMENVGDWDKSYQSYNCLSLPKEEMPLALQFAAATNVILTEFKLADHISDEKKTRYKFAYKTFSKDFAKAESFLRAREFPLGEVKAILQTQEAREREILQGSHAGILAHLAEPTARATAHFFGAGVKLIGRSELSDAAYKIGFDFGQLIYLVDAFEDFEKDFRAGQFNAVRAAFRLNEAVMGSEAKRRIVSLVNGLETQIRSEIENLPMDENQKTIFAARLSSNLRRIFKTNLPVVQSKKTCAPVAKQTFPGRWQGAKETARSLARGFSWQMPLVFTFVFVLALAAPAQTKEARSARECFDLSFNLMFLGAIFGAVLAFPKTLLMQENPEKEQARAQTWCDSCDCCCCCGEGCDCCSSCDGCGCDGCCDGCDCCSCDC